MDALGIAVATVLVDDSDDKVARALLVLLGLLGSPCLCNFSSSALLNGELVMVAAVPEGLPAVLGLLD